MTDRECVALLQWALPLLGLRWRGFKNVRRQVCRRLSLRVRDLGLDAASYKQRLEVDPEERAVLDALCFVTISRFYRDRQIYDALRDTLLPELATQHLQGIPKHLRIWSAGCASGEEPYTVAMLWHLEIAKRFPDVTIEILATDSNDEVLGRADRGVYQASSLVELPPSWRDQAFDRDSSSTTASEGLFVVRPEIKSLVTFARQDIRLFTPDAPLHIILCRNLAFTYFDSATQLAFLERISERMVDDALLIVGGHEVIPAASAPALHVFEPHPIVRHVFRFARHGRA